MAILHNSSVKAVQLNRISLVLSLIGLYIAGTMSLEKWLGIQPPCGGGDCGKVTSHPLAFWGPMPVAFVGLVGYLILTAISAIRADQTPAESRPLVKLGLLFSGIGFLASAWFQYASFMIIKGKCYWCIASALTMTALFVVHFMLNKEVSASTEETPLGRRDLPKVGIATLVIFLALAVQGSMWKKNSAGVEMSADLLQNVELVPARANIYGEASAPLTIVEFADLCCPTCQRMSPVVKEFVDKHPGRVRLVYRHFPLPMHALANTTAAMAEYAADKNRFWQFAGYFHKGEEPKEMSELKAAASAAGLDLDDMVKRLNNTKDPAHARVFRDFDAANKLGLNSTPSFIIVAPGQPTKLVKSDALFAEMENEPYKSLLKNKS
ncbi:hypothetical protein EON81_03310 [bacterium]|nr:MAG: hypothetical protein EON81_03310 [bacterium]